MVVCVCGVDVAGCVWIWMWLDVAVAGCGCLDVGVDDVSVYMRGLSLCLSNSFS